MCLFTVSGKYDQFEKIIREVVIDAIQKKLAIVTIYNYRLGAKRYIKRTGDRTAVTASKLINMVLKDVNMIKLHGQQLK